MNKFLKFFTHIFMQIVLLVSLYAQKDVTQFLGIPIDGPKPEMMKKLNAKGFTNSPFHKDVLVGEFNGTDVNIHVVTNNNIVYRIMIADAYSISETSIKIRFNNLCRQFQKNNKYTLLPLSDSDYTIPEDEDISYEMMVENKRYQAIFYQKPMKELDSITLVKELHKVLLEKYSEEQLLNPTEEIQNEILMDGFSYMLELYSKKVVWFIISESYGKYSITMYYDNEYNAPNGEDF